jgi:uncharacterized membrane protein YcaP (DUF421 family)
MMKNKERKRMITVAIRTFFIYIILNVTLRVLGKRQIGQLETTELVSALLLSELATVAISDATLPIAFSLIPVLLLMSFELLTSDIKNRNPFLKRLFEGSPGVLIERGVLDKAALKRMRISVEELLCAFRLQGVVSIDEVYYAILEQNGQLSVILKKEKQQPTIEELATPYKETGISHAIIVDGRIKKAELSASGRTERWLQNALSSRGVTSDEVFLLAVDDGGSITMIKKEEKKQKGDHT